MLTRLRWPPEMPRDDSSPAHSQHESIISCRGRSAKILRRKKTRPIFTSAQPPSCIESTTARVCLCTCPLKHTPWYRISASCSPSKPARGKVRRWGTKGRNPYVVLGPVGRQTDPRRELNVVPNGQLCGDDDNRAQRGEDNGKRQSRNPTRFGLTLEHDVLLRHIPHHLQSIRTRASARQSRHWKRGGREHEKQRRRNSPF